jgi:hypothetical protein
MSNTVCYHNVLFIFQAFKKIDADKKKEELDKMKQKYGLSTPDIHGSKPKS